MNEGDWSSAPSAKVAALTKEECLRELRELGVPFKEVGAARGVEAPIRLTGPVGGVVYRTELAEKDRATSPFEVMDCRLARALVDFSVILKKHDIAEVHMFSAWRPPAESWPLEKPGKRHPGGLAIDIRRLIKVSRPDEAPSAVDAEPPPGAKKPGAERKPDPKRKGSKTPKKSATKAPTDLVIDRDWTAVRDQKPCAPSDARRSEAETTLRAIFCTADEERLFTSMLSPNYDGAHKNHFHLEITRGVNWRLVL